PTGVIIAAVTPTTPTPSPTPTPTLTSVPPEPTPTDLPTATPTPTALPPQAVSATTVNVRSGPGTNYPVIGSMSPATPLVVTGQNEEHTWWQVQQADGSTGWVAASVVEASGTDGSPIVQTPSPPHPTATPIPPPPTLPKFQFEPTGWYDDTNYGLTRFLGNITDVNGNPANG
ncbi:MAG: SH3 domain-containing protein, partial [bacterium]|nr:SH3 domain-containing protein [bacterium]